MKAKFIGKEYQNKIEGITMLMNQQTRRGINSRE
jgi:hypothetical protein